MRAPPPNERNQVFISYSHRDKDWLERLQIHMAPLVRNRAISVWADTDIQAGDQWRASIEAALEAASVAVLLVTPNFLASDFITQQELPPMLERAARGGLKVFWIAVSPSLYEASEIARYQAANDTAKPLDSLSTSELNRELVGIAKRIWRACAGGPPTSAPQTGDLRQSPAVCIVHALPPAPAFVGRKRELAALDRFWKEDSSRIIALVGLGGAGKTAIAAEFVESVLKGRDPPAGRLFVWSFYSDQDVGNFLQECYRFFLGHECDTTGLGTLYRLADQIGTDKGRNLVVLDGLERVQRIRTDRFGGFGEFEDPLLRQVMPRIAVGLGDTRCLITTRFPVTDLEPWAGRGYMSIDVDELEENDVRSLLRRHRVQGDDLTLDRVIEAYGAHALTLDHLAIYLREFCGGDAQAAHDLKEPCVESDIREERRLARVLTAYETSLSEIEVAVLCRLCIFRGGTSVDTMLSMVREVPDRAGALKNIAMRDFLQILWRLKRFHLILQETFHGTDSYTARPAIRDHFYRLFTDSVTGHRAASGAYHQLASLDALEEWELLMESIQDLNSFTSYLKDEGTLDYALRVEEFVDDQLWHASRAAVYDHFVSRLAEGKEVDQWHWRSRAAALRRWTNTIPQLLDDAHAAFKRDLPSRRAALKQKLSAFNERFGSRLDPVTASSLVKAVIALDQDKTPVLPRVRISQARLTTRPGANYPVDAETLNLIEELIFHRIRSGDHSNAVFLYHGRLGVC